jgi:hypothetical protein
MSVTYTSGVWVVKPGEEDDFVKAWEEFVAWAADMPGSELSGWYATSTGPITS